MNNQLLSISKIFTEKLFRIPDYQRGYAWGAKQLKDFWTDVEQLETDKNHYVGVLTLEEVPPEKWRNWEDDSWIIKSKGFEPFYVVDGQQRLTTTLILLQAIIEVIGDDKKINYTSTDKIREKYIFDSREAGIPRSYIFGYEKDNPSYEFLKRKIFLEDVDGYRNEETIYTQNLESAKSFFIENLRSLDISNIEVIYKKITQNFLFNIYSISNDIDVFVAFETMNNRGKPLTNLELLKNRLIYLSTKFSDRVEERMALRKRINDTWKAIYHYLGKNKERPLNDDVFLMNHFIYAFGKELKQKYADGSPYLGIHDFRRLYDTYLLDERFTLKNIIDTESDNRLTIAIIKEYIDSLQDAVKKWFAILNPSEVDNFDEEEKLLLDKLYRLDPSDYSSLILTFYLKKPPQKLRIPFLKALERQNFLHSITYTELGWVDYLDVALNLANHDKPDFQKTIALLEEAAVKMGTSTEYVDSLVSTFKSRGFYKWRQVKYFLFEYELSLKEKSKTKRDKIDWRQYAREHREHVTVEHIYPQKPKSEDWPDSFDLHHSHKKELCNSLGNLLPLSKPKNSSLQNIPFAKKIANGKDQVGYRFGSYSENEVSGLKAWTPDEILKRGIRLIDFMEKRWNLKVGDYKKKVDLLGLSFLNKKN